MNKLLITIDYYPNVGGVARYLYGWKKKYGVDVLADGREISEERKDYSVFRKKLLWALPPKWLPLVFWSLLYSRHYEEIVISHILPAGYAALILRKPYTLILHGLDIINSGKIAWKKYWAKKILNHAKKIIVNSRATGELLRKVFGDMYNYEVEYPQIEPLPAAIKDFKQELGLENKKIILSFGRLVKRKGQEKVIRLMPKILEIVPEAVFVIAGGGPEKAKLEGLAKIFSISEKVIFLGKVKEEELSNIYSACDVFVAPSLPSKDDWEGFGMVCLEAAYFGKPVVVTNTGGLPEAVEDNVTGYVVQNDEKLLEKLITLLKNDELAKTMGEAGKERVRNKFLISNSPNF